MTQLRWRQTNSLSRRLLIAGALGLSLVFTSSALAQYVPTQPSKPSGPLGSGSIRYVPPRTSRPSDPVGSTGTRGSCGEATETSLTILAPSSHNGQTVATRPTFVWYMPDQETDSVEFSLYESGEKGRYKLVYRKPLERTKDRLQRFTLPESVPGLAVRQPYLWQVALLCDPSEPSKDKLATATIEVGAMPPELKAALAQTPDHLKRAGLYAQAGFWYDALAESLAVSSTKPIWLDLMESLSQLETPSPVAEARRQGEQLQSIVTFERRKP